MAISSRSGMDAWGGLLSDLRVSLIATDRDQRVTIWNHAAETIYGVGASNALGRRVFSDEEQLLRIDARLQTEIRTGWWAGRDWKGILDVVRPDGTTVTVRTATAPWLDEQGVIVGGVAVASLLRQFVPVPGGTEVHHSEDALARSSDASPTDASRTVGSGVPGDYRLTARQREVVDLLLQGLRVSMIAERLNVSTRTVHSHLGAVYSTLGVHSQRELLELGRVSARECRP